MKEKKPSRTKENGQGKGDLGGKGTGNGKGEKRQDARSRVWMMTKEKKMKKRADRPDRFKQKKLK